MYAVEKRDGKIVEFDLSKIKRAITMAFESTEDIEYHPSVIDSLTLKVTADFQKKIKNGIVAVEDIQDSVESVLANADYSQVAKHYILYRKQREKARNIESTLLNYRDLVNSYVNPLDVDNNDETYSVGGLILSNSGAITANYWLSEIYDSEIASAHLNGDIHIHDLSMLTAHNAGWSLKDLSNKGLANVRGNTVSKPAKHLGSFCNQMVNFLGIMQNEWSSTQTVLHFDTYLAPYVKTDNLSYSNIKRAIESFVYGVNMPSRWGSRAPFSSISFDWTVPEEIKDLDAVIHNEKMNFKYHELQNEMNLINKAFLEVMLEGDGEGKPFTYPILSYAIDKDFDFKGSENAKMLFELVLKNGSPFFANCVNNDVHKKMGEELTGSIGIVTIDLPRIAYLSKDENDFYSRLDHIIDISARSLHIKKDVLTKLLNGGLYPYTKAYLSNFDKYYSSVGIIGIYEMVLNASWIDGSLSDDVGKDFAKNVLRHIKSKLIEYQNKYQDLFELLSIADKKVACRFANNDSEKYDGIITALSDDKLIYTDSYNYSSVYQLDLFEALDIEDGLWKYTSDSCFGININEIVNDYSAISLLVKKIVDNYHLPYFKISLSMHKDSE